MRCSPHRHPRIETCSPSIARVLDLHWVGGRFRRGGPLTPLHTHTNTHTYTHIHTLTGTVERVLGRPVSPPPLRKPDAPPSLGFLTFIGLVDDFDVVVQDDQSVVMADLYCEQLRIGHLRLSGPKGLCHPNPNP